MKENMKGSSILVLILIILIGGILFFGSFPKSEFLEVEIASPKVAKLAEKEISTPPPLRAETEEKKEVLQAILSHQGVTEWTNIQRERRGLPALKENSKLNAAARAKVEEMFKNQYFGHDSPIGEGVADLAENFTYKFLTIGENLAMGNFQNDKILVDAWMNSPGHRENILNSNYQEIGVAVKRGIFEGKTTWLAVQHFGRPLSACPQPDSALKEKIDENQKQILELQKELLSLRTEIRTIRIKRDPEHAQKIEQYNILISQYNALIEENELLINQYNSQVNLFNQCVGELR